MQWNKGFKQKIFVYISGLRTTISELFAASLYVFDNAIFCLIALLACPMHVTNMLT